jgi:hypothetical protein
LLFLVIDVSLLAAERYDGTPCLFMLEGNGIACERFTGRKAECNMNTVSVVRASGRRAERTEFGALFALFDYWIRGDMQVSPQLWQLR